VAGLRVSEGELQDLLVKRLGAVTDSEFEQCRRMAVRFKVPLERALLDRTGMPVGFLLKQLAEMWGVGFVDLGLGDVESAAFQMLSEEFARAHVLMPFRRLEHKLEVAMWDPRDTSVIQQVEQMTMLRVVPYLAPEISIRRAQILYRSEVRDLLGRAVVAEAGEVLPLERPIEDERAATDLLHRIVHYAAVARTSDIHIEPYEFEVVVRCRIDGRLRDVLTLPPASLAPLVVRVKLLSSMRIDERRVPQDGQFTVDLGGFKLDFRVSSLPTVWGEKLVLRVHSQEIVLQDLEDLGLSPRDHEIVLRNIRRPYGLILMTGPTASGKSTSLYAMLMRLAMERQNTVNISTVEDPVEYRLPRVNQVQVNPTAGLEFATTLPALLRQDPDIVMVGEIRDQKTAELAVRAALVGRLVLSTLHTNDAPGAVPRLLDIGVEPFLVASTIALVVAQRLVRRICLSCRESVVLDSSILNALRARPDFERTVQVLRADGVLGQGDDPFSALRVCRGRGCADCHGSGFRRRLAIFELFEVDDEIRNMIRERQDAASIRAAAIAKGMKTLFQDGLAKMCLGETTLEEVLRVAL
jgi:type IV pilus assembly protein PilB